jgi:hypothetical protein
VGEVLQEGLVSKPEGRENLQIRLGWDNIKMDLGIGYKELASDKRVTDYTFSYIYILKL